MKRILSLVTFFMVLGVSLPFGQADAGQFYNSHLLNMGKLSFSNQYRMEVSGNIFLPKEMKEGG